MDKQPLIVLGFCQNSDWDATELPRHDNVDDAMRAASEWADPRGDASVCIVDLGVAMACKATASAMPR